MKLLNQARTGRRLSHTWFLKIGPVQIIGMRVRVCVCVCVCVCTRARLRLLITSGMMWRDMNLIRLVNKFYSCYIATVAIIINGCGLCIDTHRGSQPNKS